MINKQNFEKIEILQKFNVGKFHEKHTNFKNPVLDEFSTKLHKWRIVIELICRIFQYIIFNEIIKGAGNAHFKKNILSTRMSEFSGIS
jgi:hypothetical protein